MTLSTENRKMIGNVISSDSNSIPIDIRQRFNNNNKPLLKITKKLHESYKITQDDLYSSTKETSKDAKKAKTYKLSCQLSEPLEPVQFFCAWFIDNEPINNSMNPKYQTSFDQNLIANLVIYDFCEDDCNLEYSCVFITEEGNRTASSTFLDLDHTSFRSCKPKNNVKADTTSSMKQQKPKAAETTQKKSVKFNSENDIRTFSEDSDETSSIDSNYTKIITAYCLPNTNIAFQIKNLPSKTSPYNWHLNTGLTSTEIKEESQESNHNTNLNRSNKKYILHDSSTKQSASKVLIIFNVTELDQGMYVFYDETLGQTIKFLLNFVDYRKLNQPLKSQPPRFVKKPESARIEDISRGEELKLSSVCIGYPPPYIRWFKHKTLLEPSKHFEYKQFGNNATLTITNTRWFDTGKYHCKVVNALGEATISTDVLISDKDENGNALTDTKIDQTVPIFIQRPHSINCKFNRVATFNCIVAGNPMPKIKWLFENEEIQENNSQNSKKYKISTSGDGHLKLKVNDVRKADLGKYVCEASNVHGSTFCATKLKMSKSKSGLYDTGTTGDILETDITPSFTQFPAQMELDFGKDAILRAQVEASPRASVSWLKDGKRIDLSDNSRYTYSENCQQSANDNTMSIVKSKLKISNVSPQDSGNYICWAVNRLGEVSSTVPIEVRSLEEIQARIKRCLPNISVQGAGASKKSSIRLVKLTAGKTARITLAIHGLPLPKVTWYKDSSQLYPGNRIAMFNEPNRRKPNEECAYILKIARIRKSDEGLYTVLAINSVGLTKTMINVVIKDPSWQDLFATLPQNVTAQEGTDITLSCKTKKPANVIWKKVNSPIDLANTDRYRVTTDGISHELTIFDCCLDDRAKYWACVGQVQVGATVDVAESVISTSFSDQEPLMIISRPGISHVDIPNKGTLVLQYKLNYDNIPVKWFLNKVLLENNNRSRIKVKGGLHTLILCGTTSADNGFVTFSAGETPELNGRIDFRCILPPHKPEIIHAVLDENNLKAIISWEYHKQDDYVEEVFLERKLNEKMEWERLATLPAETQQEYKMPKPKPGCTFRIAFSNSAGPSPYENVFVPITEKIDFIKPLKDMTIEKNQPIMLAVELSAEIERKFVSWIVNGAKIENLNQQNNEGNGFQLDQVQNVHTISVPKIMELGDIEITFSVDLMETEGKEVPLTTNCIVTVLEKSIKMVGELEPVEVTLDGKFVPSCIFTASLDQGWSQAFYIFDCHQVI